MPELTYRFATLADVPAIVALVESAYRGEESERGWTSEAHLLGGQRTDPGMIEEALARPGTHILLAEEDGELVVCCEINAPGPDGKTADPRPSLNDPAMDPVDHGCGPGHSPPATAYFGMFSVKPSLQTGGYGKRVLAEAERVAREELGAEAMEMTVIRQRGPLIEWYERRGYVRTGERRPFPYGDERYGVPKVDDLEMVVLAKQL